jgi:KAP-like P-loop domain-containing protein
VSATTAEPTRIESFEELSAWLDDKPEKWKQFVAVRASLRIFPFTLRVFEIPNEAFREDEKRRFVVAGFRAAFAAWARAYYHELGRNFPEIKNDPRAAELRVAAREIGDELLVATMDAVATAAATVAYAAKSQDAFSIIENAMRTATIIDNRIKKDLRSRVDAPDAVINGEGLAVDLCWKAITADVQLLEADAQENLMQRPLWLNDVRGKPKYKVNFPNWARTSYDNFARSGIGNKPPWNVWHIWYNALLVGLRKSVDESAFGRNIDLHILSVGESFWERNPDAVMADLAELTGGATLELPTIKSTSEAFTPTLTSADPDSNPLQNPVPDPAPFLETEIRDISKASTDGPADPDKDSLLRKPYAHAFARFLNDVHKGELKALEERRKKAGKASKDIKGQGFVAHLYAPWGAGKTTVLDMMKQYMASPERNGDNRWVVVDFNAWRHEHRNPPWWPLLEAIKSDCYHGLKNRRKHLEAWSLWVRWQASNINAFAGPYIIAILILLAGFWVAQWGLTKIVGENSQNNLNTLFSLIAATATAFGAFLLFGRRLIFGSRQNEKIHEALSQDPMERVEKLFKMLVRHTGVQICVFIDDLDRCEASFVVHLLEGIQTTFRHENVVYVVAADKKWIRASFEAMYGEFKDSVGGARQPLGYLFLEKIFQVSAPLPSLSPQIKKAFASGLIGGDDKNAEQSQTNSTVADKVEDRLKALNEFSKGRMTGSMAHDYLKEHDSDADRAAVVDALSSSQTAHEEVEHRLHRFGHLFPEIPRVMIRLVNAYTLRQYSEFLQGEMTPPNVLARWIILEQRFPALVELLIYNPRRIEYFLSEPKEEDLEIFPDELKPFADLEEIRKIVGVGNEGVLESDALSEVYVRVLTRGSRA